MLNSLLPPQPLTVRREKSRPPDAEKWSQVQPTNLIPHAVPRTPAASYLTKVSLAWVRLTRTHIALDRPCNPFRHVMDILTALVSPQPSTFGGKSFARRKSYNFCPPAFLNPLFTTDLGAGREIVGLSIFHSHKADAARLCCATVLAYTLGFFGFIAIGSSLWTLLIKLLRLAQHLWTLYISGISLNSSPKFFLPSPRLLLFPDLYPSIESDFHTIKFAS